MATQQELKPANWFVIRQTETFVVICDEGPWDTHKTITDDIDDIWKELVRHNIICNERRLYYVDFCGQVWKVEKRACKFQRTLVSDKVEAALLLKYR